MQSIPVDILGNPIREGTVIAYASASSRGHLKHGYVLKVESENNPYQETYWDHTNRTLVHTGNMIDRWSHRIFQVSICFGKKHWKDENKTWYLRSPRWVPVYAAKMITICPYHYTEDIGRLIEMAKAKYEQTTKT